jgi:hypothetical protein
MAEAGLWTTRKKRRARVYQPRYRRDCVGELVQIDGSEHRWFEVGVPGQQSRRRGRGLACFPAGPMASTRSEGAQG